MNLKQKITNNFPITPMGVDVFLFGSILSTENVNDIDIAIIYDKTKLEVKEAIEIRKKVRTHIRTIVDFPSEIILLSIEENNEMEFILNTKTELIKSTNS